MWFFHKLKLKFILRRALLTARRAKDEGKSVDETISQQKIRDQQDSSRKAAPMKVPEDSLVVDNSQMSFEAVVKTVEDHIRQVLKI